MLKLKSLIAPTALVAAFTLTAAPSFAQQKYHGRQSDERPQAGAPAGESRQPQTESRQQQPERAQPRAEQPRQVEQPGQAQPQRQAGQPRQAEQPRQAQPQRQAGQPRQAEQPRAQNRGDDNRAHDNRGNDNRRSDNRGSDNRGSDNRGDDHRRYEGGRAVPRGNVYAPHYEPHYSPNYSPRGYGYYGSRSYYRPYVFRPRYSIGFGIFSGYPVPYSYSYSDPIWIYGYRAPRERVFVTPGSAYYGGIALEMTPYDADVFVDGTYAGRVEDFDGATQPLTLSAGVHEIEVQAQGYEPMRVNVDVQPGQVIPYRGDLRPY